MSRAARRRRSPTIVIAGVLLLIAVIGVGAYALGWVDHWRGDDDEPPAAMAGPTPGTPTIPAEATSDSLKKAAVRRALNPRLDDDRLGKRVAAQVAPLSGAPVLSRNGHLATPASTTKLATGAGVIKSLGPDRTFTTTVTRKGKRVTLVGGGDGLLVAENLRELARDTAQDLRDRKKPITLIFDDSYFPGNGIAPAWESDYVPDQVVAEITALMVDEGRTPGPDGELHTLDDGRSYDPSRQAADVFAGHLRNQGVKVGEVKPGKSRGQEIASLEGAPVSRMVEYAITTSSNEVTEVLAHQAGLEVEGEASFEAGVSAVESGLASLGVGVTDVDLDDGSGLARSDRLRASVLTQVLQAAASSDHADLAPLLTGLPIAGFTGTGVDRFEDDAEVGRGVARLKSGTLTGVHSYAGIVDDAKGTPMVVVMLADRVSDGGSLEARDALDDAAAALAACTCS